MTTCFFLPSRAKLIGQAQGRQESQESVVSVNLGMPDRALVFATLLPCAERQTLRWRGNAPFLTWCHQPIQEQLYGSEAIH